MRKSLFALLLALCMVVCFAAITVSAEEITAAHTDHCICGGVELTESGKENHTCSETNPTWQPLGEDNESTYFKVNNSNNRYEPKSAELWLYLTEDVDLDHTIALSKGYTIHLCLNGRNLSYKNADSPVMRVWGTLDITDCSENADGSITGSYASGAGCLWVQNWVSGDNFATPTVNLFAGTLTADDNNSAAQAGVIMLGNKANSENNNYATFNMFGGAITGGKASQGGSIYLHNAASVVNMYGGTITGGSATTGGNIYIDLGIFTMKDGTITGGTTTGDGGNVYVGAGNFEQSGGIIGADDGDTVGGSAKNGGNVVLNSADSVFTMTGGTISGGTVTANGGNVFVNNGNFEMDGIGAVISGGKATGTGNGGNVRITNGTFTLIEGTLCPITKDDGTKVGATAVNGGNVAVGGSGTFDMQGGLVTGGNTTGHGGNIITYGIVKISGGKVTNGTTTDSNRGGGNISVYGSGNMPQAVISGNAEISGGKALKGMGGNLFLNFARSNATTYYFKLQDSATIKEGTAKNGGNIAISAAISMDNVVIEGGTVTGGTATENGGNIYLQSDYEKETECKGRLKITNGTISNGTAVNGGNIYGAYTSKTVDGTTHNMASEIEMSGGIISGGSATTGGSIYLCGEMTMSGGTIGGDNVTTFGGKATNGGNVALGNANASFTMNAGSTISGGKATTNGGNVFVENGSFTMEDGTITSGNADNGGGNVRVNTTFNMNGGTISNGKAKEGGNVVVGPNSGKGLFKMTGGTITGGNASGTHGGNITVYGTLDLSAGLVEKGTAQQQGGNISGLNNYSKILISGDAVITDGKTTTQDGGNIYVKFDVSTKDRCKLVISGGTISNGTAATNGGNISIDTVKAGISEVTISGGTITGGKATKNGGNIYLANAVITVSDKAVISGGTANEGGNVALSNTADIFTMNGGSIEGGVSTARGGSIYIDKGTFELNDGIISGGKAGSTGGNIRINSGTFNMNGGTISGGDGTQGGNVAIGADGTFNLNDGTVTGGKATAYDGHGGNFLAFGTLNIYSGLVENGEAVKEGGNISGFQNKSNILIEGGTISGGNAGTQGGNIFVNFLSSNNSGADKLGLTITGNAVIEKGTAKNGGNIALTGRLENASVVISGGTISGGNASGKGDGIYVSSGDLTIKDAAQLDNEGVDLYVINADETTAVTIQNIADEIVVDAADKAVAFASSTEDCSDKLVSADEAYIVFWIEGKLFLKKLNTAAVYAGKELVQEYKTFEEAAAAAMSGAGYVKLLDNTVSDFEVTGVLYLDLNGYDLSGIIVSGTLYGMDSTTDAYDDANAGILTYTLSGEGVVPVHHKAEANVTGAVRRYLTYTEEDGSVSFHRIYLGITRISLRPGVVGVGYKAQFGADEKAQSMLDMSEAFGYSLWLEQKDGTQIGRTATAYKGADAFSSGDFVTLRLQNFPVAEHGETLVCANVYLKLNDEAGTVIDSTEYQCTLRQMLELADGYFNDYTEVQQKALVKMCADHADAMISWDLPNIHKAEGSGWQSVTKDELIALFADNKVSINGNDNRTVLPAGRYELSEDVNIGGRTIVINEGETVSICLNGHKLTGSATMFRNFGTLNICDCHGSDAEGHVVSTVKSATANGGVLYSYYESVTNLYGGSLEAEGNVSSAGVVAISHDAQADEDKAKPAAVFNMYGGSISGGNAANGGGNISLWNKSTFNLYNGTVSGGTAGATGGNIHSTSGCTVNIYGGTVTGGTANGGSGGNIYNSGKLNMYGGTVTGGTATGLGDGVSVESTASAYISGDVIIDGNNDSNLYKRGYWNVDIEDLGANAKIGVSGDTHGVIYNDAAAVTQFASDDEAYKVCAANGKVMLVGVDYTPEEIASEITTFSVGYDITNINPTDELLAKGLAMSSWGNASGRTSYESSSRELHATTVAITDANNNTVLMVTLDLQGHLTYHDRFRSMISEATGVPVDNIYLSATHTHNCPDITSGNENNVQYVYYLTDLLIESALGAMADRAPATMQTGSFDTDSLNFGRHYKYTKVTSIIPYTKETIYVGDNFGTPYTDSWLTSDLTRVREGDETMHLLAFQRGDEKQPVLVANWRAHPNRSGGADETKLDADVIGATRNYITANSDYLFAYFQGAAGNMNTTSRISGENEFSASDYDDNINVHGNEMGRQILAVGLPKLQSVPTGLIQTEKISYSALVDHREDAKAAKVDEFVKLYDAADKTEQQRLLEEYGFSSKFHAQRVKAKANMGEAQDLELNVFSIGNSVGFYTAPAELWDSFSEEIEGKSPFKTTFCIGYSNGYVAYIPYNLVEADNEYGYKVAYDSYEGDFCLFIEEKVAPEMMAEYLEELQKQFENAK